MPASLLLLTCASCAAVAASAWGAGGGATRFVTKGTATRIVRFADDLNVVRYGHASLEELAVLSRGGRASVAECCADGTGLHGARALTGERVGVRTLLAPIPKPPVIYGIGLNYLTHAHEANLTVPLHPAVFFKNRNSHNDPLKPVSIPPQSSLPDYEGELAFVFAKDCKDVAAADAMGCVLGFTAANDVSARCWQADKTAPDKCLLQNETYHPKPIGQWSFSKSFDSHCPLGPALLTTDDPSGRFKDGSGLQLQTHLNGKLMQNQTTSDLIFNISKIVAFLSQGTTIDAGTVVVTGTPGGIGYTRKPPVLLKDGDNVTISIAGIGSLTNFISRKNQEEL